MSMMEQTRSALLRLAQELEGRSVGKFPPERELAARLGTSRTTVRSALDALEREGLVHRVKGRAGGAFLTSVHADAPTPENARSLCASRRLSRNLNTVMGVPQMLQEQGFQDGTRVLSARMERPSPRAAQVLGVSPDRDVISLLRLRFADGDTLSLERMYLGDPGCRDLLRTHMDSVYEALRCKFGIDISATDESIELAEVSSSVSTLLGQPMPAPVLKLERIGYDQHERPVEYSVDLFRADRTRLSVSTRPGHRV